MSDCPHESFTAKVGVHRLADDDGAVRNYIADVTVNCAACGIPFHFLGVGCGLSFARPMSNVGSTTLSAPIAPGEGPMPDRMKYEVS